RGKRSRRSRRSRRFEVKLDGHYLPLVDHSPDRRFAMRVLVGLEAQRGISAEPSPLDFGKSGTKGRREASAGIWSGTVECTPEARRERVPQWCKARSVLKVI